MDLILDGSGPLYMQLARAIKSGVANGRFPDRCRLPATRDLARELRLSRSTVTAAYQLLGSEGILVGRVGSGSYVRAPRRAAGMRLAPLPGVGKPSSAYSRRARSQHWKGSAPEQRPEGARHAFLYSVPVVSTTLPEVWRREVAKAAAYLPSSYPPPEGLASLREAICTHIGRERGVVCKPDDILVVNGAQQAFNLIARVVLDPADCVVMEDPSYDRARKLFQVHGAQVSHVPVDDEGLRVDLIPPDGQPLVYVTPSHQYPTGVVMSVERRAALLAFAERNRSWILEDDFDGEYRQEGRPMPALQAMDRHGQVIYVGSFSKTLFPSLRLGYVVMPPALRDSFIAAKWTEDLGSPALEQCAMANLMLSGAYDRHLRQATHILARRREKLKHALADACGDGVRIAPSHGGMHLLVWVEDIGSDEAEAFLRVAEDGRLGVYGVNRFYAATPPAALGLMLGYSAMPESEIQQAVRAFAQCLAQYRATRHRRMRAHA